METGENATHLSVNRTPTVDSTTSTNSSFDDATSEGDQRVKDERSERSEKTEPIDIGNSDRGDGRRPSVGLRETRIIISQDESVAVDDGGVDDGDGEEEETRKRSESLHKLHQQHALDSWDQEGDSASSSSRSSSTTRVSPCLSPSPSHRTHHQVRHTMSSCSSSSSSAPPNINSFISLMCLGSSVMKVKRQGRTSSKMLYLDSTRSYIRWKPSKKGHKAIVNIKSVREIREGACTDTFKKHLASTSAHKPSHCFSIIHGTSWESLDIVAGSLDEAQAWIRGLRHLMEQAQEETAQSDQLRDSWLRSVFESADKSGDGLLSMDEVLKLLHKLNVNLSKRKVKQLFREADSNIDEHLGKLDFDEFVHFYKTLSMRPELYALLREYSCGKEHMTLDDVDVFLRNEQGISKLNEQMCQSLIEKYEPVPENVCNSRMGIDGLMRYLLSEEGDLFNSGHRGVNQDMTHPLSHYYIASSHNTYLLGDQLMSQSSVDVYGLVLQAGCRCVELDTWDGKDGDPVIYHGYTLTSKIKFRDVITVVNKYAFVSSAYPVILSIENHCTLEQQKMMAKYLLEILGDQLIISSPPDGGGLPSPESLKYKILIKAKKLPLDHDADLEAGEVSEEDSADELDEDFKLEKTETRSKFESIAMAQLALMRKKPISPSQQAWQRIAHKRLERLKALLEATELKEKNSENKSSKNGRTGLTGTFRKLKATRRRAKLQHSSESDNNSSIEFDRSSSRDDDLDGGPNENQQAEHRKQRLASTSRKRAFVLSRQLSDLVKYTRSVAFKGFPENMPCWELPSLGEMRANNLAATRAADFANFTTHNLCRVYPSAYRIDSSNFNPQPLWNCGCQLVALNYQTEGRAMQLLRAKFRANGNCGYVLKPNILRQDKVQFEPTSTNPIPGVQKKQLTIHVISGQQLPKPPQSLLGERGEIIDPYVEVEVIGLSGDCTKAQTKTVQDNGFNPVWDYVITFPITLPELTLIRFVVWDEDPIGRDFIGQATLPFTSLCQGYRHIHLEGLDHATIFVHVTIEDFTDKQKYVKNSKGLRSTSITRSTSSPSRSRTKSIDTEVSLMTGGSPIHTASPKRRTSLAERLGIRRRHSTTALLVEGIMSVGSAGSVGGSSGIKSPTSPTSTPTFGLLRQKRRSYEGEMRKGRSQGEDDGCDDVFGEDEPDLIPVDCDAILDRIMSSKVAVELEADGSMSVPLNQIEDILRLGISPSQILQVIQDARLSLRPALQDARPPSTLGDSWEVVPSNVDVDSTHMEVLEVLEHGDISKLEHCDPAPASKGTLSRIIDADDLVFPMNNNDISTEMEALLSARFTKGRLAYGVPSFDECSSTEDCSSLGSAEDLVMDIRAAGRVINGEPSNQVTNDTSGDVVGEHSREMRGQEIHRGLNRDLLQEADSLQHCSVNGSNEIQIKNKIQGQSCATVEQSVDGCKDIVISSSQHDESLHFSNHDDILGQKDDVAFGNGNPTFPTCISKCNMDNDILNPSHVSASSVDSTNKANVHCIDNSDRNNQCQDNEEFLLQSHVQGQCITAFQGNVHNQNKTEPDLNYQDQCKLVEQCSPDGQMGSLSFVVDSMLDLVACLAEEEQELQTIEERITCPNRKEAKEGTVGTEDKALGDYVTSQPESSEYYIPSSQQHFEQDQSMVEFSSKRRHSDQHIGGISFIDTSCNQSEVSDHLSAPVTQRPLAPTGLSPDTPPIHWGSQTAFMNTEADAPNSLTLSRGSRKRSLVKVLSGIFQKYELFEGKQTDSFSKGLRASLRKRFMTRSVPDISDIKGHDGYSEKIQKKVWSSSNQDISSTGAGSKSIENLCGILEESQSSIITPKWSSSCTDIGRTNDESLACEAGHVVDSATETGVNVDHDCKGTMLQEGFLDENPSDDLTFVTEDKAVQTDFVTSGEHTEDQVSKVNRLKPGSWTRDGQPTRPLSCPVLPQETGHENNKHRIVYFQEQPLEKPPEISIVEKKNCKVDERPERNIEQESKKDFLDIEEMRLTLADVSSEGPYSGDEAAELSSHICVVKGCDCGVIDLSTLLDSSLLVETCFTADGILRPDLDAREREQAMDTKGENPSSDATTEAAQTVSTEKQISEDDNGSVSDTSPGVAHSISSIHTHLGGNRRSIGTFRSEYNRSFDEGETTDEEAETLTSKNQDIILPDVSTEEQAPCSITESTVSIGLLPIQEMEILDDSFSSESIPSTNSADGILILDNFDTDPEQHDNTAIGRDADVSEEENCDDDQDRNVTPTNDISTSNQEGSLCNTKGDMSLQVDEDLSSPKSSSSDSSYDVFKSLEELSTVLNDELLHGRKRSRTVDSISMGHSIETTSAMSGFRNELSNTESEKLESDKVESTDTEQDRRNSPIRCKGATFSSHDTRHIDQRGTRKNILGRVQSTPTLPESPVIGSAISVKFLGQIPRQMSAYTYSDSDSDYDSTTSGSSQETVVEVIPNLLPFARPLIKPPVPPKSPKIKAQLTKQGSKDRPPVPPKPAHLKALVAEKKARALQKSISLAASSGSSVPRAPSTPSCDKDFCMFNFGDGVALVEGQKEGDIDEQIHQNILSSGMLSPGLVHSFTTIPSEMSASSTDFNKPCYTDGTSLQGHLESKYNVTMRKRCGAKPPLEQRHSTGSLFSLANLPSIKDKVAGFESANAKTNAGDEFIDILDESVEGWSLDRKRKSSQRVYFMLNV